MASTRATIFPSLLPSELDQAWFNGTYTFTNEAVISKVEEAYEDWKMQIRNEGSGVLPYGGYMTRWCMVMTDLPMY